MSETFEEVKKLGVTGIDMESSCMLTLGRLMGVKTCILTMVTVLENLKEKLVGQERTDAGRSALQNSPGRNLSLSYENGGRKK